MSWFPCSILGGTTTISLFPRISVPPNPNPNPFYLSSSTLITPTTLSISLIARFSFSPVSAMDKQDEATEQEYALHSNLLQEFTAISAIDKAWLFKSHTASASQAMFCVSQPNLLVNKRKKSVVSAAVLRQNDGSVAFQWAPFPIEMCGVSAVVPSPSGSKLLIVRNPESEGPCRLEIWSSSQLEKEFHIPQSKHGSVYADGWFEGISWNSDETCIAYVAEEPSPAKPTFNDLGGYKKGGSPDKDSGTWKGQGEWEEDWGETYSGKRQPALFVIDITSGEVQAVKGIDKSLSVGQVVWAPSTEGSAQYLVFVGWSFETRKLGIKYCYNRPCALYVVKAPHHESKADIHSTEDVQAVNLTQTISSAFFPRFSPDGNFLVFVSARSSVDSGAHSATDSLHRIDWPKDTKLYQSANIHEVIPVVLFAEDGCFPGLYCSTILSDPWLSDGYTLVIASIWHSSQVLLSVNVLSGEILRITPADSNFSWSLLTLDGNDILAVSSSPVDVPQIKYGAIVEKAANNSKEWSWSDVSNPIFKCSEKVRSLISSLTFSVMKISVKDVSENLTKGASQPYEAIFVSSKTKKSDACDPLIVILHGGPHSVSLSSFSKPLAYLSSLGYSLLIVNYRGSLGFGEEALQSLPGKVGSQDVNDVLTAIDHVIKLGLASPSKIAVLGGSHGGFLTTHLIGQAPEKFVAAAARNPVCNLALMVGTTDIPDWCYVETYGTKGRDKFTEAPSAEDLTQFYGKSPIAHLSKVKTPTLFLLGAQDLRVPISTGLQYARALREKGVQVKVIVFPNDVHGIDRPQSDFESYLSIAIWFNKYCK
ncbi:acylamino-acid-releasing enzyme isoform X2 [Cajanus cajan]|uniref:acylamino-acid-releasing enzyme isoform X2 n=1 Tax=Cajanus cajan TaxID=3821 RepID=UPI00098DBBCF|nr:acylamino-acid-releasing enzyme isoform X2 [Cajanus cajan]